VSQPWTCPLQGISSFNLPTFGRMINTCVRSVFWERRCSSVPTSCSIRARSVGLVNQPKTGKTTQQLLGSQTWRVDEEKSA
jgi:hypothetical protein